MAKAAGESQYFDEFYEKPSQHRQWQERAERPVATRPMTAEEIEEFRYNLASSYKCNPNDIIYVMRKIRDENDEDRDDCLWLKYIMKYVTHDGKVANREIFSLKIPVPEHIRRMAAEQRANGTTIRIRRRELPSSASGGDSGALVATSPAAPGRNTPSTSTNTPRQAAASVTARPRLRKAAGGKK